MPTSNHIRSKSTPDERRLLAATVLSAVLVVRDTIRLLWLGLATLLLLLLLW